MNRPVPYTDGELLDLLKELDPIIDRLRNARLGGHELLAELDVLDPMLLRAASASARSHVDGFQRELCKAVESYQKEGSKLASSGRHADLADALSEVQRHAATLAANAPAFDTPVALGDDP